MTLNEMQQEMNRGNNIYFRNTGNSTKNAYIREVFWGYKKKIRVTTGDGVLCDINRKRRYFDTLEEAVKYLEDNGYVYVNPWK